jgi:hypothetical protein
VNSIKHMKMLLSVRSPSLVQAVVAAAAAAAVGAADGAALPPAPALVRAPLRPAVSGAAPRALARMT